MVRIDLVGVIELQNRRAQLVEVLSQRQFEEHHLPGAISLPLSKFNSSELAKLDRDRPIVVYCWDYQWDLSPRAAARLEAAGFREVYDYVGGKADWLAMGMPSEGALANATIKTLIHEVPVCRLGENAASVKSRISTDWNISVVIDPEQVVLGVLEFPIHEKSDAAIAELMKPAPLTFRPSVLIAEAIEYFDQSDRTFVLVTKSTGELMGALRASDLKTHQHQ